MRLTHLVSLVAAGVLGCGSGSGEGGGTCGQVAPCGGSVVGSWRLASGCVPEDPLLGTDLTSLCPTATSAVKSAGGATLTYNANHTYVMTGVVATDLELTIPTACSPQVGTCADLNALYVQLTQTDPEFTGATCSTSGAACVCDITMSYDASESGTYATDLTTLAVIPAGQMAAANVPYCVQGKELHVLTFDMTMPIGPMGMAKLMTDFVYARQ